MARDFKNHNADIWYNGFRNESSVYSIFPVTIAAWVWVENNAADMWIAGCLSSGDKNASYFDIGIQGTTLKASADAKHGIGYRRSLSTGNITLKKWHHVAGVFTAGAPATTNATRLVYLDGVAGSIQSTATTHGTDPNWTVIGSRDGDGSTDRSLDGRIMWPSFWTTDLSVGEIQELARGVPPNKVRPNDLASWVRCDEQSMPSSYASVVDSADPSQTWVENAHNITITSIDWAAGVTTMTSSENLFLNQHVRVDNVSSTGPGTFDTPNARLHFQIVNTSLFHGPVIDPGVEDASSADDGRVSGRIMMGDGPTQATLPAGPKTLRTSPYSFRTSP